MRRGSQQLRRLASAGIDPQRRHHCVVQPAIAEYRRDDAEREVFQRQSTHMQDKKKWQQAGSPLISTIALMMRRRSARLKRRA
ncbi:hypothetical protein HMPREF9080_02327 [Cardiobacterium valvarum F0432]|uniref:Uncharacterized protein n=1 Tax=Cardiobacterium valvarum F0432 TaxID=797473 RepID=G9ZHR9_9GAMM|nr:hypothetical protein HMPREF9080_02327 [Cardiobacterium valvarum F0432]